MAKRNEVAIEVLKNGGFFRYQLERTYMGREQFAMRLIDANRNVVKGVGFAAKLALEAKLARRDCHYGSTCKQEWVLA